MEEKFSKKIVILEKYVGNKELSESESKNKNSGKH